MAVALLDANCTAAPTTAVLLRVTDGLRPAIPGNPTAAVLAHEPPLGRSEAFTVLRGVEAVRPASEHCAVICVAELVVLLGVNEFVPNNGTELLPPVLFVGRPVMSSVETVYWWAAGCSLMVSTGRSTENN